jgi:hypothetical protein
MTKLKGTFATIQTRITLVNYETSLLQIMGKIYKGMLREWTLYHKQLTLFQMVSAEEKE